MKKFVSIIGIIGAIIVFSLNAGTAQMLPTSGVPGLYYPFFYAPPVSPFYPPLPFFPWPAGVPGLRTASMQPLLAPMRGTLPLRNAAATITIIFNPALSIVNISAVPITAIAATPAAIVAVPTVAAVPTLSTVPTLAPTALVALLPALISAVPTKPYTQTIKISTTTVAAPVVPAATTIIPGLTGLLPLI